MTKKIETVPNQRILTIQKLPADTNHKYTVNNLEALGEAARRLQSKGGFKLYMYLAKNQNNYKFALSSTDFCSWSGLGIAAYRTAFEELKTEGYLIARDQTKENECIFTFYDKSQLEDPNKDQDKTIIEIPEEKVKEVQKLLQEDFSF